MPFQSEIPLLTHIIFSPPFQSLQINLSQMLCPAISDPFYGQNYRLWTLLHQSLFVPILNKIFVYTSTFFITKWKFTKIKNCLNFDIEKSCGCQGEYLNKENYFGGDGYHGNQNGGDSDGRYHSNHDDGNSYHSNEENNSNTSTSNRNHSNNHENSPRHHGNHNNVNTTATTTTTTMTNCNVLDNSNKFFNHYFNIV